MPETILVVDDEEGIVEFIEMSLMREQYAVIKAYNGTDALASVRRDSPDLVLLDIGLPDIDGFEVAQRLREAGSHTAIVLASSRDGSDFGPLIAESGARGFVEKAKLSGDAVRALVA